MTITTEAPADFLVFLDRVGAALDAMFTGDPRPYAALWPDRGDVTLYGAWGPIEQGRAPVTRTFDWVASRFSDGVMEPYDYRVVAVDGDLAYTVGFERGVVRVDGGPRAPMVLRVTHGFRRIDGDWWLVHRHADYPPPDPRKG
ncbi:ketosteroid isomerase-like protein [Actinomycetospora succinea]|uniref:Ketosteroid isomerase-like protein n=1 Tax=Actinomycetospora succinea TaxID=663603 RepID=A0A4R6VS13_9PSEU|nr:nuclear transport factor 2 family protein [Actinomycetospora succinea]TDQ62660.1 ketosteroid isomerase-like protein [Actinomycetospora succinea]